MNRFAPLVLLVAALLAQFAAGGALAAQPDKKDIEQAAAINTELAVEYLKQGKLAAARASFEQAAAAAESLEEQSRGLVEAVAMFRLVAGSTNLPAPALRDATPRALPGARS